MAESSNDRLSHTSPGAADTSSGARTADAEEQRYPGDFGFTAAGTAATEEMSNLERRDACRFDVLRNALVHTDRLGFFEFSHRLLMFAIVLSGTAGFGDLLNGQKWFAAFTALLATIDLVFDLKGRIATHKDLRRRYYLLLADIDAQPAPTSTELAEWSSRMIKITADEPGEMPMVDAVAFNRAIEMLGLDRSHKLELSVWEKTLRHVWTYTGRTDMQAQVRDAQDNH